MEQFLPDYVDKIYKRADYIIIFRPFRKIARCLEFSLKDKQNHSAILSVLSVFLYFCTLHHFQNNQTLS